MLLRILLTFIVSLIATHVAATPCDCSKTEGSCQATSNYQNGSLVIRSNTTQCSFVVYTINGNPSVSTVIAQKQNVRVKPHQIIRMEAL